MLIQTKPKEVGKPIDAVQFLGDPSVHPDIYQETCAITKKTHWRLRTSEGRGSQWLGVGYWIIGRGWNVETIDPITFKRDWQVVPTETSHEHIYAGSFD